VLVLQATLSKPREVVGGREEDDDGELTFGLGDGAETHRLVGQADSDVAVETDQDGRPDGGRLDD